jgi:hypothetical protein
MKLHFDVKFLLRQKTKVRLAKFTVLALVLIFTAVAAPLFAWAAEKTQFRFKGLVALAFFDGSMDVSLHQRVVRASGALNSVRPAQRPMPPGSVNPTPPGLLPSTAEAPPSQL